MHEHGIRIVVGTLGPFKGFEVTPGTPLGEWTAEKEASRTAVNTFLRASHEFDGVVDFDAVLRDPSNPAALRAAFDSGDHIHPNDVGSQAMANAIPLRLLL